MSEQQEAVKQFAIQKLYVKDVSFESPSSPQSFSFKKWEPKIDLNLSNNQLTELPDELTAMNQLEELNLSGNPLPPRYAALHRTDGWFDEMTGYAESPNPPYRVDS